ncbi:MAG TPA: hypothetical protein VNZ45_16000 [Bacteroidia bacterium]|jgi:hypothetical protein|nr:hypothetical protein [Bacteroidia bacterium]
MEGILFKTCFLAATALTGLLCGASLDQSIKQLPARRVIGAKAFSEYAKAADLKNGVLWYALLGLGAALFSITTAILVLLNYPQSTYSLPLYFAGLFAVCHTFCTTQAAPTYHSQKKIQDESALEKLLNKFERIQTFRSIFIVLNFMCFIWALIIML